jgi:hypothetical protein
MPIVSRTLRQVRPHAWQELCRVQHGSPIRNSAAETEMTEEVRSTRIGAMADLELLVAQHQPDGDGRCLSCPDRPRYPCDPLWVLEEAAMRLALRRGVSARRPAEPLGAATSCDGSKPRDGWRRSRFADGVAGPHVEIRRTPGAVAFRDSETEGRVPLIFPDAAWRAFVRGIRAGEFDDAGAGVTLPRLSGRSRFDRPRRP